MNSSFLENTQDFNPLTWDIQLNPAAWWLSLKDINSAASVELKSSLYSGNLNLTADQYREVQSLVADKYSAIDVSGIISTWSITKDWQLAGGIDMTGKNSWLYMSNDRLWFYDGTAWQVWIGNNGDFFFGWDVDNYIEWSGSVLTVKWDIEVADGSITAPKLAASLVYAWEIVIDTSGEIRSGQTAYDTGTWFWLWDVAWVKKFSIGNGTKWLKWDGSDLTIRGNIYAESGTFAGSITSSATITGWTIQTGTSWQRVVITGSVLQSYSSSGTVPKFQTSLLWVAFRYDNSWVICWMYSQPDESWIPFIELEWILRVNQIRTYNNANIWWSLSVWINATIWGNQVYHAWNLNIYNYMQFVSAWPWYVQMAANWTIYTLQRI